MKYETENVFASCQNKDFFHLIQMMKNIIAIASLMQIALIYTENENVFIFAVAAPCKEYNLICMCEYMKSQFFSPFIKIEKSKYITKL